MEHEEALKLAVEEALERYLESAFRLGKSPNEVEPVNETRIRASRIMHRWADRKYIETLERINKKRRL